MSSDFYQLHILPHSGMIIKICRAYTYTQEDFEDYYQEVCLQIWKSRESFQEKAKWSTWVYRLTLNVCLTLVKKENKKKLALQATQPEEQDTASEFDDDALNMLYEAIKRLSEIDRAVILLYLEENSYQDIADVIGSNANNIGVRISRIKERLKKILDEKAVY